MDSALVLFVSLFQVLSMGGAAPLPDQIANTINELVTRLNNLKALEEVPQQDDGSGGSLHIVDFLMDYGSFISPNLKDVAQIKSDVSSLADSLSQLPCKDQLPEVLTPELGRLKSDKTQYSESVTETVLLRIKMVLTGLDVPC